MVLLEVHTSPPRSTGGGEMRDPGNEVDQIFPYISFYACAKGRREWQNMSVFTCDPSASAAKLGDDLPTDKRNQRML